MNRPATELRSILRQAIGGTAVQLSFIAVLSGSLLIEATDPAWHLLWTALAGGAVWLQTTISLALESRLADFDARTPARQNGDPATDRLRRSRQRVQSFAKLHRRYFSRVLEAAALAAYGYSTAAWFLNQDAAPPPEVAQTLSLTALYACAALAATVTAVYFLHLVRDVAAHQLRVPTLHQASLAALFCVPLADVLSIHIGFAFASVFFRPIVPIYNGLLAAERLVSLTLRPLRPRRPDAAVAEPFDSYLLDIVWHPSRIGAISRNMLRDVLGFDVSATAAYRFVSRLALPLIVLSAALLMFMSTVVIVAPGSQALTMTFGRFSDKVLGPGLHFKAPWPVGSVRAVPTDQLRRIHVGSHRPETPEASVFREGVPLLWTNLHGLRGEEFLVVASPKKLIRSAVESGGKINASGLQAPSISLAGADIVVEYVIGNLRNYLEAYTDPELLLSILAEAHVSEHILQYEIDDLFSDQRIRMAQVLRDAIQHSCDSVSLGIRVVHVGITAVHPPLEVAAAFEENIAARQDRETRVGQARQLVIRSQVETAGSVADFQKLIAKIDSEERGTADGRTETERLLLSTGGEVSRIMSEALGYRWSREDIEGGNAERFARELELLHAAPELYRYERYFTVLETTVGQRKKIVLTGGHSDAVLGLDSGSTWRSMDPFSLEADSP